MRYFLFSILCSSLSLGFFSLVAHADAPPSLDVGLVGHWTFDGRDMTVNARDTSGQGNNGSLSGFTSTTTIPGKIGQALNFDGTSQGVNLGNPASLPDGNSPFTFSAWIKPSANQDGIIVGKGKRKFFSRHRHVLNHRNIYHYGAVFCVRKL